MNLQNHPKALYLILFFEFIIRFTSWGLISVFVLYGINHLSKNFSALYLMQGTFVALSFALTPLGGYFADHVFGFKRSLQFGFIFLTLGTICLGLFSNNYAYIGFSFLAFGLGLVISNNASYLGIFYEKDDVRKTPAFTFLYAATNFGALIGPIVYGYLSEFFKWNFVFYLNAIFLILAYTSFFLFKKLLRFDQKFSSKNSKFFTYSFFPCFLFFLLLIFLFNHPSFTFLFLLTAFITALGYLYRKLRSQDKISEFYNLVYMMIFCILFFASEFQVNSSLIIFINKYVNKAFFSTHLPASAFSSIEPFFVVLMAPCVAFFVRGVFKKNSKRTALFKIFTSFLLEAAGFMVIYYAAIFAKNGNLVPSYQIFFAYLLIGVGELLLMPCVIAAITDAMPSTLRGISMGCLYLSIAISGYLSGVIASFTERLGGHSVLANYSSIYYDLALLSSFCAILVVMVALSIKKETEANLSCVDK